MLLILTFFDQSTKLQLFLSTFFFEHRPGNTAWWGLHNIGKPVKGETIFVSAASGAVGQIVAQLAKKEGLFVIGSAGSDSKVEWLNSLGCFDITFNCKFS